MPAESEEKPEPPKIQVGEGEALPVAAVELSLAMGSGPLLRVQPLSSGLIPFALRQEQFGAHLRGKFTWQEKELDFRFLAANESTQGEYEIHGLVLSEDLLGWFQTPLNTDNGRPMLVYQRQDADSRGWSFLRRVLGDKFEEPTFSEKIESWFDPGVCILRPTGWKHLAHIRRVVDLLGGLPGATCGWCAFSTEKNDDPLRFISAEVPPLALDTSWRLVTTDNNRMPHELGDVAGETYVVRRRFVDVDAKTAAELLSLLAKTGRRSSLEEGIKKKEMVGQLPHMPMPVRLRDTDYFCERASFRVSSSHTLLSPSIPVLDIELMLRGLPTRKWGNTITHRGVGTFSKWVGGDFKTRLRLKSAEQTWMLMGDDGQDDDGGETDREACSATMSLVTESVTPYSARGENAGFYVKHQVDDALVVEIADLAVPRTHGGLQEFNENFEGPELTLNSRTIVVTGVAKTGKLNVTGVRFDGDAGSVEIYAEEKVRIKEKITVVDEKSSFEQDVGISGTLQVKKDTTLSANLNVEGDAKIKGKTDVGQ